MLVKKTIHGNAVSTSTLMMWKHIGLLKGVVRRGKLYGETLDVIQYGPNRIRNDARWRSAMCKARLERVASQ